MNPAPKPESPTRLRPCLRSPDLPRQDSGAQYYAREAEREAREVFRPRSIAEIRKQVDEGVSEMLYGTREANHG